MYNNSKEIWYIWTWKLKGKLGWELIECIMMMFCRISSYKTWVVVIL